MIEQKSRSILRITSTFCRTAFSRIAGGDGCGEPLPNVGDAEKKEAEKQKLAEKCLSKDVS
jgi:hypothetical protein